MKELGIAGQDIPKPGHHLGKTLIRTIRPGKAKNWNREKESKSKRRRKRNKNTNRMNHKKYL
jgi:hypothetical protein